jgi:hypothetical protein
VRKPHRKVSRSAESSKPVCPRCGSGENVILSGPALRCMSCLCNF